MVRGIQQVQSARFELVTDGFQQVEARQIITGAAQEEQRNRDGLEGDQRAGCPASRADAAGRRRRPGRTLPPVEFPPRPWTSSARRRSVLPPGPASRGRLPCRRDRRTDGLRANGLRVAPFAVFHVREASGTSRYRRRPGVRRSSAALACRMFVLAPCPRTRHMAGVGRADQEGGYLPFSGVARKRPTFASIAGIPPHFLCIARLYAG